MSAGWLIVLRKTLLLRAHEPAGLVILVEGEDLTLNAHWKARAVSYNRWLQHLPQKGEAKLVMAKVLWGDSEVSCSC